MKRIVAVGMVVLASLFIGVAYAGNDQGNGKPAAVAYPGNEQGGGKLAR